MTFEQLEYFVLVEEYKGFSKAAEENYLSQPTLSKQIKALEKEIGVTLFVRNARSVSLTEEGEEFSKYVHRILKEYSMMKAALKDYGKKRKKLTISTIPVASVSGLLKVTHAFSEFYDTVDIELIEQDTYSALQSLEKGISDMAFIRSKFVPEKGYGAYPLMKDELVLVVGQNHSLAKQKSIFLREAQFEKFIFLGSNTGLYHICMDECKKAGFIPDAKIKNVRVETLEEILVEKNCVSLLMYSTAKRLLPGNQLKILYLKEHPQMDICLVIKLDDLTDLKKTFIEFATDYMDDYDGKFILE